jgi:hypothetical protein
MSITHNIHLSHSIDILDEPFRSSSSPNSPSGLTSSSGAIYRGIDVSVLWFVVGRLQMAEFLVLWIYFLTSFFIAILLFLSHFLFQRKYLPLPQDSLSFLSLLLIGGYTARWSLSSTTTSPLLISEPYMISFLA